MNYLWIILILSFVLEGIVSLLIPMIDTLFLPLFTIVALVVIFPYIPKHHYEFECCLVLIGFCYDLIYTNTVCMHAILFFLLGYWIRFLSRSFSEHFSSQIFIVILSILLYQLSNFFLFIITGTLSFNYVLLRNAIVGSLISNLIYAVLLYGLLNFLKKRKKISFHY